MGFKKFFQSPIFSDEAEPKRPGGARNHPRVDLSFPVTELTSPASSDDPSPPPANSPLRLRGGGDVKRLEDDERIPKWAWFFSGGTGRPPTAGEVRTRRRVSAEREEVRRRGTQREAREKGEARPLVDAYGNPHFDVSDDEDDYPEDSSGEDTVRDESLVTRKGLTFAVTAEVTMKAAIAQAAMVKAVTAGAIMKAAIAQADMVKAATAEATMKAAMVKAATAEPITVKATTPEAIAAGDHRLPGHPARWSSAAARTSTRGCTDIIGGHKTRHSFPPSFPTARRATHAELT
ncbi:hypothetical protein FGG08_007203 [Glutinoglossum americanum]|uniref:Uncharacterized protein n=1 Tax=Glutinoglossum americanum TaxID=1670608 RepID=A0A9P8KWP6_9PEZI|nr:hypothetical protein FGG08_007203 [Glutinoglossum americanum]